jgi:hypothetical protein
MRERRKEIWSGKGYQQDRCQQNRENRAKKVAFFRACASNVQFLLHRGNPDFISFTLRQIQKRLRYGIGRATG